LIYKSFLKPRKSFCWEEGLNSPNAGAVAGESLQSFSRMRQAHDERRM